MTTFEHWLVERYKSAGAWVIIGGIFGYFVAVNALFPGFSPAMKIDGAQLVLILACLFVFETYWTFQQGSTTKREDVRAMKTAKQFHTCLLYLLRTWGLFYAAMFALALKSAVFGAYSHLLLNALNNASTVALFLCYWVMAEDTTERSGVPTTAAIGALAAMTLIDFYCTSTRGGVPSMIDWSFAIAGGTALGLFASRLESIYIRPPRFLVIVLFVYAALQPLWPAFDLFPQLQLPVIVFAFIAKGLLFAFIYWICCVQQTFYGYVVNVNAVLDP